MEMNFRSSVSKSAPFLWHEPENDKKYFAGTLFEILQRRFSDDAGKTICVEFSRVTVAAGVRCPQCGGRNDDSLSAVMALQRKVGRVVLNAPAWWFGSADTFIVVFTSLRSRRVGDNAPYLVIRVGGGVHSCAD